MEKLFLSVRWHWTILGLCALSFKDRKDKVLQIIKFTYQRKVMQYSKDINKSS